MTTPRLLLLTSIACMSTSCTPVGSPGKSDGYDTSNPYGAGTADTAATNPSPAAPTGNPANSETASYQPVNPVNPPANPTYAPAAYEENTSTKHATKPSTKPSTTPKGKKPAATAATKPAAHASPASAAPAGATVYTVVAGDSLSKISHKYHVPIASIKAANHMTNDTVVIGKKLQIPAR